MGFAMKIAIVGCGLIGKKRAIALKKSGHEVCAVSDLDVGRARSLADSIGPDAKVAADWNEIAALNNVEMVVVATTNDFLMPITMAMVKAGKHVLVEKPAARNVAEIEALRHVLQLQSGKVQVKVGFNLRFHPALVKAKQIVDQGLVGPLLFIRGRYGHGGRVGYDREWRADPAVAGGGELLDQGVHLIDLSRWFLGDMEQVSGFVHTYFWDMPVEDNGFMFLKTQREQVAWLQVSCSEWKNMFCLEVYGRDGKLQVDGIGGSYGTEKLTYYKMLPEMGPPETTAWEYPGEDKSWQDELDDFITAIKSGKTVTGNLDDAYAAMDVVDKIYKAKGFSL